MQLYPFQQKGVEWLMAQRRRYLADDPGLGKTVQAAFAMLELGVRQATVVCPAGVRNVWHRTLEAICPKVHREVLSYDEHRTGVWTVPEPEVFTLDEAHYAKNTSAARTLSTMVHAQHADRFWALSGTPVPNHPGELYPILRAIWPDLLRKHGVPNKRLFDNKYLFMKPGYPRRQVLGVQAKDDLLDMLRKLMLRRTVDDVQIELPPLRWEHMVIDGKSDREMEKALGESYARVLAQLTAGASVTDLPDIPWPTLQKIIGMTKVPYVLRALESEIVGKLPLVIGAWNHDVIAALEEGVRQMGATVATFTGRTPKKARQEAIDGFQNGEVQVFIGQLTSSGIGITLHRAHEVVIAQQSWRPDENFQFAKRIHRIGQELPCRARIISMADSLDSLIARTNLRKMRIQGAVLTGLDGDTA